MQLTESESAAVMSSTMKTSLSTIDGHTHVGVDLLFYLRGQFPYAQDWPALVEQGRRTGIDRFIVFPTVSNLAMNIDAMRQGKVSSDGALETIPYAFENRRLMSEIHQLF